MGKQRLVQKAELALAQLAQSEAANIDAASANFVSQTNASPIATAISATWTSSPVTVPAGPAKRFRIMGMISGVADAVDRVGQVELLVDGSTVGGLELVAAGHVTANIGGSLEWISAALAPGAHTFGVKITLTAGTITVGTNEAVIVAEERSA